MSVVKVIEILANSTKSWEDAAQSAVNEASQTVRNIKSVNIKNLSAEVNNNKITEYRLNCKISFGIE